MRDYRDKTVVITGAGSGIGKALALDFAGRSARLALSDNRSEALNATVDECSSQGADTQGWPVDVSDRNAVYRHADEVVGR